jgi:hypothetical protein
MGRNAGAKFDAFGVLRGERQTDEDITVKHLRIVEPGVSEPTVFGNYEILPRIGAGRVCDCEFHSRLQTAG